MICLLRFAAILAICFVSPWSLAQVPNTHPLDGIRNLGIDTVVLENATVVCRAGKTIEQGMIVIRDGKIVAIGKSIPAPIGSKRIDMTGKTIYPGWIDGYVEVEIPMPDGAKGAPYWNPNIVPQRCTAETYQASADQWAKYRKAGITSVLAVPNGGIVRGTSSVIATNDQPAEKSILAPKALDHLRLTVNFGFRGGYPSSPMGAVALARQAFFDAEWYRKAWQAYRSQPSLPQPEWNAALQAIVDLQASNRLVMVDTLNEQYALRADQFAREMGLPILLHGSGREYRLVDRIASLNRAIVLPVNFPKAPNVSSPELAFNVPLQDLMHWELAPENPARLVAAGVKLAITSEGLEDPSELRTQLRLAIARGLSPDDALQAVTTTPAQLLGIEHLTGSLATGKSADLLITNGDVFAEKTKIEETWVQGTRYRWTEEKSLNVDGTWELELSGSDNKPAKLEMVLSSEKKWSGSLRLPKPPVAEKAPEVAVETSTEKEEPPSPNRDTPKADSKEAEPKKQDAKSENAKKESSDKASLEKLAVADARLSAIFTIDPFLKRDAAQPAADPKTEAKEEADANLAQLTLVYLTASKLPDASKDGTWLGTIHWPDGSQSKVTGRKMVGSDELASSKNDGAKSKDGSQKDSLEKPSLAKNKDEAKAPSKKTLSTLNYPFGEFGRQGVPEQPEWLIIKNAQLWTSGPEGTLNQADMLIQNGIIQKIGRNLETPAGAVILDAAGKHVTPGIIDCHSHMATDSGVNESGQSVTAEVRIGDFVDATDYTIYCQLAGGVTIANVLHGSANPIGGQNQVIKLRWGGIYDDLKMKEAPAGIKFALGENVKQSNRSEPGDRYPQSRMGVEQIIRDRFEAALEYDKQWKAWQREAKGLPPRRDLELEAIAEILRGERWIHCHSYRQDEILALLRLLEEYHVTIGSLQHILEGYKVAEAMAKHGAMGSSFSDWWGYKYEVIDAIPFNGALMHKMGIVVSFNSDDHELGRHLNHEAAKAVKYGGVPPDQALQFVTLNPAKQLRIDRWVGSLEVGKQADFVLWSGSPLSPASRCEQTWIDGRKYFDREADLAERKQVSDLHRRLVQKVLAGDGPMAKPGERDLDASTLWPRFDEFCHHHHDEEDYYLHLESEEHAHEEKR